MTVQESRVGVCEELYGYESVVKGHNILPDHLAGGLTGERELQASL